MNKMSQVNRDPFTNVSKFKYNVLVATLLRIKQNTRVIELHEQVQRMRSDRDKCKQSGTPLDPQKSPTAKFDDDCGRDLYGLRATALSCAEGSEE